MQKSKAGRVLDDRTWDQLPSGDAGWLEPRPTSLPVVGQAAWSDLSFYEGQIEDRLTFMEGQISQVVAEKLLAALQRPGFSGTERQVHRPQVPNKALAVIGMRRAGKTTYLHQIRDELLAQGRSPERLVYFNFEDERLAAMEAKDLGVVTDTWRRLFPEPSAEPLTLFLDEIQRVPGWELFARRLLDTPGHELFLSGSSAKLLSREVATSMRGRALEVPIAPFSFHEFLIHHGRPIPDPSRVSLQAASVVERDFLRYLHDGGFPEAQGIELRDRHQLLSGYVDIVLLRDVIERHAVTNVTALRWLIRRLLSTPAGTLSVSKLVADFRSQGVPVSKDALHQYLAYLEDTFVIATVSVATSSERRRQTNPRKVYPADTALMPLYDRSQKTNVGHALETVVFHELQRRGADVSYVKNSSGTEVDFLARDATGGETLIQVCANIDDDDTRARECRGLEEAKKEWPHARRLLLTLKHQVPTPDVGDLEILPVWRWMLMAER